MCLQQTTSGLLPDALVVAMLPVYTDGWQRVQAVMRLQGRTESTAPLEAALRRLAQDPAGLTSAQVPELESLFQVGDC